MTYEELKESSMTGARELGEKWGQTVYFCDNTQ